MSLFKCKMCGGDLIALENSNVAKCDSCGSMQTLPSASDEQKANLFNRANHLRRMNDFDRAVTAYENLLNIDDKDAEAHWGLLLSRYGIEYVEDPISHDRVPTCHRVQNAPVLTDPDYQAAIEHAPDYYAQRVYEAEGKRIADIQKGILTIAANEKPYDVFICYKESTDGGSRTKDSALAQDIYYSLTKEGYKVFFSRITLESKLGQQYEPYIFAALNSARVMLVIGTQPEYFIAVWVKNEWSRYLALMKKDRSKLLIPCYQGMDPYNLPEELSMLQSQDMSKIGFMQDLLRGVEKVLKAKPTTTAPVRPAVAPAVAVAPGVQSLYERALLFLEDGDFERAEEYSDRILDINPKYAPAYICKLCAAFEVQCEADLSDLEESIAENGDYQKALRFADKTQKAAYIGYEQAIQDTLIEIEEEEEAREEAAARKLELEETQRLKVMTRWVLLMVVGVILLILSLNSR